MSYLLRIESITHESYLCVCYSGKFSRSDTSTVSYPWAFYPEGVGSIRLSELQDSKQNKTIQQQQPNHNINKNKKYSHCLWLLKFPYLLNVVHEVPTVDIFHDEV